MENQFQFDEPAPPPVVVPPPEEASAALNHAWEEEETTLPIDIRETAYWLAGGLVFAALLGCVPAIFRILDRLHNDDAPELARWVYVACAIGILQIAYAVYLAQLPDWSSLWCTAIIAVVVASAYALLAGMTLSPETTHPVVSWLQLHEELADRRAAGWCALVFLTTGGWAYLGGRFAVRTRRELQA